MASLRSMPPVATELMIGTLFLTSKRSFSSFSTLLPSQKAFSLACLRARYLPIVKGIGAKGRRYIIFFKIFLSPIVHSLADLDWCID